MVPNDDSKNINGLQLDVAVIKNDIAGIKLSQQTMMAKMESFDFVKSTDLIRFKTEVETNYVQKSDYNNMVWLLRTLVVGLIGLATYTIQVRK